MEAATGEVCVYNEKVPEDACAPLFGANSWFFYARELYLRRGKMEGEAEKRQKGEELLGQNRGR